MTEVQAIERFQIPAFFKLVPAHSGEVENCWPFVVATELGKVELGQENVTTETIYLYPPWIGWTGVLGPSVFILAVIAFACAFYIESAVLFLIGMVGMAVSLVAVTAAIQSVRNRKIARTENTKMDR